MGRITQSIIVVALTVTAGCGTTEPETPWSELPVHYTQEQATSPAYAEQIDRCRRDYHRINADGSYDCKR